jgi:hypothetical protein
MGFVGRTNEFMIPRPADVKHLDPRRLEGRQARGDEFIDPPRSLAAPMSVFFLGFSPKKAKPSSFEGRFATEGRKGVPTTSTRLLGPKCRAQASNPTSTARENFALRRFAFPGIAFDS